jgi:hypothetical protein
VDVYRDAIDDIEERRTAIEAQAIAEDSFINVDLERIIVTGLDNKGGQTASNALIWESGSATGIEPEF